MSARTRRRSTAAAIALAAAVTAGFALTACGPEDAAGAGGDAPSATSSAGKGADGRPAASDSPADGGDAGKGGKLNGTAHNGLTISDGSRYVVMNGTRVDFGTAVRDLAWSSDGKQAAFVDGSGDLVVSAPDGSGRTVVARNPGGENWSHPTWQVRAAHPKDGEEAMDNLLFAARKSGVSRLYSVPATAHDGTPKLLSLNAVVGEHIKPLPQTGNVWPSAGGEFGSAAYANSDGKVYVRDDYLRQQGSPLAQGSEPAFGPETDDGVVFVRSVGGHDHLFRETPTDDGPTFKDLTPNAATDYTEPVFSRDGETIAARTPDGIVTLPADGSAAPVKVSDYTGLPAYRS